MVCVANVESTASYMAILASCINYMSSFHGIDLVEKTSTIFSDGHAGAKVAILALFPLALHKLCLKHAQTNVGTIGVAGSIHFERYLCPPRKAWAAENLHRLL